MLGNLKHFDGSLLKIGCTSDDLEKIFLPVLEVEPEWIDIGQSFNLYLKDKVIMTVSSFYDKQLQK